MFVPLEITVRDEDRNVDYRLSVDPYLDDAGRYVEPNEVKLEAVVTWIGDYGCEAEPETNIAAKHSGGVLLGKFWGEIHEACQQEIKRLQEVEA